MKPLRLSTRLWLAWSVLCSTLVSVRWEPDRITLELENTKALRERIRS